MLGFIANSKRWQIGHVYVFACPPVAGRMSHQRTESVIEEELSVAIPGPPSTAPLRATPRASDNHDRRSLQYCHHHRAYARIHGTKGSRASCPGSCNEHVLRALKGLTGAAQRWGLYGCIWTDYALNFTSGPKNVKSGSWTGVGGGNYYHRFMLFPDPATTIRDGQVSSQFNVKPDYHRLALKSTSSAYPGSHHWVDHLWLNTDRMVHVLARTLCRGSSR